MSKQEKDFCSILQEMFKSRKVLTKRYETNLAKRNFDRNGNDLLYQSRFKRKYTDLQNLQ